MRKVKRIGAYTVYFCLMFLFIYDCYFKHFTFTTNNIIAFIGMLILPFYLVNNHTIQRDTLTCLSLFVGLIIYSLVVQMINGTSDRSFLTNELVRNIMLPFFSSFLLAFCGRKLINNFREICRLMVIESVVQCLIILAAFFNSSLKTLLINMQTISQRELNSLNAGIRSVGLGTRFDFGAFTMSMIMILTCYLYITAENTREKNIYTIVLFLQTISGLFLARSIIIGVVVSIVFILASNKNFIEKVGIGFKTISLVLILVALVISVFPNILVKYSKSFSWMFQYVLKDSGYTGSDSLKAISEEMYFWPGSMKTCLFGDGVFQSSEGIPYMNTDPLYMRYILFFGIIGLLLFIAFYASVVNKMKGMKNRVCINSMLNNSFSLMTTMLFLTAMIVYAKLNYHFFKIFFFFIWFLELNVFKNKGEYRVSNN